MEAPKKTITEVVWHSLHSCYLYFAYVTLRDYKDPRLAAVPAIHYGDKQAWDIVRNCSDCLEASIEFAFNTFNIGQLPKDLAVPGMATFVRRKWRTLALADRYSLLSIMVTGSSFWRSDEEYSLFRELRDIRDVMTHPRPAGYEKTIEVDHDVTHENGDYEWAGYEIASKPLRPRAKHAIAKFIENPADLSLADAQKAFEILCYHLLRIENMCWGRPNSQFGVSDFLEGSRLKLRILRPLDLLQTLRVETQFHEIWKGPELGPQVPVASGSQDRF